MPDKHSDQLEDRIVAALASRSLLERGSRTRRTAALAVLATALLMMTAFVALRPLQWERWGEVQPNYMLALYTTAAYVSEAADSRPSRSEEYAAWARTRSTSDRLIVGGGELTDKVRVLGRPVSSSGELAGYFLVRADSREDAVALAQSSPHLRYGGTIAVYEIGS